MLNCLQNTLHIGNIPAGNLHLLLKVMLGALGLGIPFVVLGRILLRRQQWVQGDGNGSARLIIEVLTYQLALPPFHPIEVRRD